MRQPVDLIRPGERAVGEHQLLRARRGVHDLLLVTAPEVIYGQPAIRRDRQLTDARILIGPGRANDHNRETLRSLDLDPKPLGLEPLHDLLGVRAVARLDRNLQQRTLHGDARPLLEAPCSEVGWVGAEEPARRLLRGDARGFRYGCPDRETRGPWPTCQGAEEAAMKATRKPMAESGSAR